MLERSPWRTLCLLCTVLTFFSCGISITAATTLEIQISTNSDDAEEDSGNDVKLNNSKLELGQMPWVGFRFQNVTIPQGSTVDTAYLIFKSESSNTETTHLTIFGDDVNNSVTFSSSNKLSTRSLTSASVTWSSVANWSSGGTHNSPEIKTIVQEIVDRGSWSSGNSLSILFRSDDTNGKRLPHARDGSSSNSAKLHVEYTASSGTTYYVRTDGSNSNSGTGNSASEAWASVSSAVDKTAINPGDIVYVMSGTYNGSVTPSIDGSSGSPIQFIADTDGSIFGGAGGAVVLDAPEESDALQISSDDYLEFYGFTIKGDNDEAQSVDIDSSTGVKLSRCYIYNAGAEGIDISGSTVDIINCLIYDNSSDGIEVNSGSSVTVWNTTIANNGTDGVQVTGGSVTVYNSISAFNSDDGFDLDGGTLNHTYNIVYGNSGSAFEGTSLSTGETTSDPMFYDESSHAYQLLDGSPAIDAGTNAAGTVDVDILGTARPIDSVWDIGCYEGNITSMDVSLYVSTTGGATYGGLTVEDEDIGFYDTDTSTASRIFEGDVIYASDEDTDAYHLQSNGTFLLSTVDSATIGGLSFNDEDVVQYDPNTGATTMLFDGSAIFSGDEDLDAFTVLNNGNYVLSTAGSATIGSLNFNDEDLVEYNPSSGTATMYLDGSTVITDESGNGHDINAVHVDSSGIIYLSMTENSSINGFSFGDDDVVRYDPNSNTATIAFNGGSLFSSTSEDIDAISLPVSITPELVGHWQLNETSGSTAYDQSTLTNDGTYNSGYSLGQTGPYPGDLDNAAQFNGTSSYVEVPDNSAYSSHASTGITVAAWVKVLAFNTDGHFQDRQPIVSKGNSNDWEWALFAYDDGRAYFDIWQQDGAGHSSATGGNIPVGKWVHVAGTFEPGVATRVYINGELIDESNSFNGNPNDGTKNLRIGSRLDSQFLNAVISDVRVYSYPMTATEITDLYGLVGHWKMDEGTGTTAADSTNYSNDATLSGTTWASSCRGNAVAYDGVSDYADIASQTQNFSRGFSVAIWAKPTAVDYWARFVELGNGPENDSIVLGRMQSTNTLALRLYDGSLGASEQALDIAGQVELDKWQHFVATIDNSGAASLYKDGELIGSGTIGTPGSVTRTQNYVGRSSWGSDEYYEGETYDVRIYNRPLSNEEISELSGLIAHWNLNETSGSVADDAGVAANDATYVSSPTLGVDGPYPTSTGTAVELNGTSQSITSGQSLLNDLSEFTIMGWIRPDNTTNDKSFFGQNDLIELGIDYASNQIDLWTAAGGSVSATVQLPYGKWSHLAATGSGTELKIYVNGRELASGGSSTASYGSNSYEFKIGEGVLDPSGDYFDGRIDDVRVYGRLLCPDEINGAYKEGRPSGVRILEWVETR